MDDRLSPPRFSASAFSAASHRAAMQPQWKAQLNIGLEGILNPTAFF